MKPGNSGWLVYGCIALATCIASVTCIAGALTSEKNPGKITLNVSLNGGNKSSPVLYGIMFEVRNLVVLRIDFR